MRSMSNTHVANIYLKYIRFGDKYIEHLEFTLNMQSQAGVLV